MLVKKRFYINYDLRYKIKNDIKVYYNNYRSIRINNKNNEKMIFI